jgi:hypothetical protein
MLEQILIAEPVSNSAGFALVADHLRVVAFDCAFAQLSRFIVVFANTLLFGGASRARQDGPVIRRISIRQATA